MNALNMFEKLVIDKVPENNATTSVSSKEEAGFFLYVHWLDVECAQRIIVHKWFHFFLGFGVENTDNSKRISDK